MSDDPGSVATSQDPTPEPGTDPNGRMNARQVAALAVAGALTLAGAGYSLATLDTRQALASHAASGPSPSPSPSRASLPSSSGTAAPGSTAPSTSGPTPGVGASASADGLLIPPDPWERIADATAKTGRVDLARAVAIDGHGDLSRTGLQQLGFSSGLSRAWQAGGAALLVLDYTFRDVKGAAGFVSYGRRARDKDKAFRRVPVSGIPAAVRYETVGTDAPTGVILFYRGRSAYIVGVQGAPPPGAAGDLNALAAQQYRAGG